MKPIKADFSFKEISRITKYLGLFLLVFLVFAKGMSQTKEPLIRVLSPDPAINMKLEFFQKVRANAKAQKLRVIFL